MLKDKLLEQAAPTDAVAKEPIFVNMSHYPVLVATPEGRYINLPGNCKAAVVGPGFEHYVEKRILMQAGSNYKGPVVYAVKLTRRTFPEKTLPATPKVPEAGEDLSALTRELTEEEARSYGVARPAPPAPPAPDETPTVEEILSFGPATADGSPAPASVSPAPREKPSRFVQEAVPAPKSKDGIPTGKPTLPSRARLQLMKHRDLVAVSEKLGLKTGGMSRHALLARLLPLAKD
jgi:hypothetical protein